MRLYNVISITLGKIFMSASLGRVNTMFGQQKRLVTWHPTVLLCFGIIINDSPVLQNVTVVFTAKKVSKMKEKFFLLFHRRTIKGA